MKVVHTIKDLQAELAVLRAQGKRWDWFLQWVLYMRDMHLW